MSPHGSPGLNHDYDYPSAFSLFQPDSNAILGSDTVSFHWTTSIQSHPQLTQSYIIDISEDSTFATFLSHTVDDTFIVVDSLGNRDQTSEYYWRVRAENNLNMMTFSGQGHTGWSFTIQKESLPTTRFTLEAPYPNPFNNSTRIGFGVPESGEVEIIIYDLTGRIVGTNGGSYAAGRHFIYFPEQGQHNFLSSGIYFITANYTGEILTKKLVYLK